MKKARIPGQGSKWIRREKRLAIYLRDGLACAWCGHGLEDNAALTLDHLTPNSLGGSNEATNLVTACRQCNTVRGVRPTPEFAAAVAGYIDADTQAILDHIDDLVARPVDVASAKDLIAARGSYTEALQSC